MKRARTYLAVASVTTLTLAGLGFAACTATKLPDVGGLMVIVSTDGKLEVDTLEVTVSQNTRTSERTTRNYASKTFTLPNTIAIVSNGDPTTTAFVRVTARNKSGIVVDVRDTVVQEVPTERLAALSIVLSVNCTGTVTPAGESTCAEGESCDPRSGACKSAIVSAGSLGTYVAGSELDAGVDSTVDVGDSSDVDLDTELMDANLDTNVMPDPDTAVGDSVVTETRDTLTSDMGGPISDWIVKATGRSDPKAIFVDKTGEWVVGSFLTGATPDFSFPGGAVLNGSGSGEDGFLLRLDSEGKHIFSRGYGGAAADHFTAVTAAAPLTAGELTVPTVGGDFAGVWKSKKADSTEVVLTSTGVDGVVAGLESADGSIRWADAVTGKGNQYVNALVGTTILYVGGTFNTEVAGAGVTTIPSKGARDAFVQRRSQADGKVVWTKQIGGAKDDDLVALAYDDKFVYALVAFEGALVVPAVAAPLAPSSIIVKLAADTGTILWSRSFGPKTTAGFFNGRSLALVRSGADTTLFVGGKCQGVGIVSDAGEAIADLPTTAVGYGCVFRISEAGAAVPPHALFGTDATSVDHLTVTNDSRVFAMGNVTGKIGDSSPIPGFDVNDVWTARLGTPISNLDKIWRAAGTIQSPRGLATSATNLFWIGLNVEGPATVIGRNAR